MRYQVGQIFHQAEWNSEFQVIWMTEDCYYAIIRYENGDDDIIMTDTIDEWIDNGICTKVRYEQIRVTITVEKS